ncbi:MAG TPA: lytic murein transglycosylase, partial [Bdellovibrionales bacterium]|nr:lytic murein transglycosylase [Bdellovibrionales bacterium]
ERPEVVKHLKFSANKYGPVTPKVRREIDDRVESKANWALNELKSIEKISKTRRIALKGWLGSHSGAFGMSQFLPSSYIAYAKTFRANGWPNINRADDAIASVANYLHLNGWKRWNAKTHSKSLYRYNKSHDYVAAIMSISKRVREPASLPD